MHAREAAHERARTSALLEQVDRDKVSTPVVPDELTALSSSASGFAAEQTGEGTFDQERCRSGMSRAPMHAWLCESGLCCLAMLSRACLCTCEREVSGSDSNYPSLIPAACTHTRFQRNGAGSWHCLRLRRPSVLSFTTREATSTLSLPVAVRTLLCPPTPRHCGHQKSPQ